MKSVIAAAILLIIVLLAVGSVGATKPNKTDKDLPHQVCNVNPSKEKNPHCKPKDVEPELKPCPQGTYDTGLVKAGQRLCKLHPTGCPYGDTIKIEDCENAKPIEPAPATTLPTTNPVPDNDLPEFEGK